MGRGVREGMTILLIILGGLVALPLTALGLPGLWAYLAAVGLWKLANDAAPISWTVILIAFAVATVAEVIEFTLASRYATKYGGSRRAGWGAIIGGIAGALVGVPIPVVGSVIGSFVGAFAGAMVAELSVHGRHRDAGRAAYGALVGRVLAMAVKVALTVVVMGVLLVGALV
jgi:uncharacterized protein YqgC (DUF456 family)